MDKFKKAIEDKIIEKIFLAAYNKTDILGNHVFRILSENGVRFIIDRYKAELARNKELGVG